MSLVGRFSGDGEQDMIAAALLGLSLVVNAAFEPTDLSPNAGADGRQMTARQKFSAMRPVVRSATDCVVRTVTADPRFRRTPAADMNELIVASMGSCADAMRALIETHDELTDTNIKQDEGKPSLVRHGTGRGIHSRIHRVGAGEFR